MCPERGPEKWLRFRGVRDLDRCCGVDASGSNSSRGPRGRATRVRRDAQEGLALVSDEIGTSLRSWDERRCSQPEAALQAYSQLDPRLVVLDDERLIWITEQIAGEVPEMLRPLFDVAASTGSSRGARIALNKLAIGHWYRGELDPAERHWVRAVELGRETRDSTWLSSLQNLSLLFTQRGRFFEGLVFSGMAIRVGSELGDPAPVAFGSVRRANLLIQLGELDRARECLDRAESIRSSLPDGPQRSLIETTALSVWSRLHRECGDWIKALTASERQIELYRDLPQSQRAVLAGAYWARTRALFELRPDESNRWIEELDRNIDLLDLDEAWEPNRRYNAAELRLRVAIRPPVDMESAKCSAAYLLDHIERCRQSDQRVAEASWIARALASLGCDSESRRASEVAASTTLMRILEIDRAVREFPDLADATAEDWDVMAAHRRRLHLQHCEFCDVLRDLWAPGEPAFDLVSGSRRLIVSCAWCRRVVTATGVWMPLPQFVPESPTFRATHGICPPCRDRVLRETGL